jgi:hypothetical protein
MRILALIGLVGGTLTLALAGAGVATALGGGGMASAAHPLKLDAKQQGPTKVQLHRVQLLRTADVSTPAGAYRLLRGLGINPRGVVIQRGARNYAGPNCPGKGWTCTTAKRVLQASGDNSYECTTGGGSPPNTCSITQTSGGSARCVERSTVSPSVNQKCIITQGPNPSGDNRVEVIQVIDQKDKDSATQSAGQKTTITQSNTGSGANYVSVKQDVKQKIEGNGGLVIEQNQRARQSVDVDQTSEAGDNVSKVSQSQDQNENAAKAGTINQFQNTDEGGIGVCTIENACYHLVQQSDTGRNSTDLDQKLSQSQQAAQASGGQEAQGECDTGVTPCVPDPFASGLGHDFTQNSSGVSTQKSDQGENQSQHRAQTGTMTFSQVGPVRKDDGFQFDNPANQATQIQNSKQSSKGDGTGVLSDLLTDECSSSGLCTVHQHVDSNGFKQDNDLTAPFFFVTIACGEANVGGEEETPPFCTPTQSTGGD